MLARLGRYRTPDSRRGGQSPAQVLAYQDGELDLGHVQPAAVLGRIAKVQRVEQAPRFRWRNCSMERCRRVHVQDEGYPRMMPIDELLEPVRVIPRCVPAGDADMAPVRERLTGHEEVTGACTLICMLASSGWPTAAGMVCGFRWAPGRAARRGRPWGTSDRRASRTGPARP